MSGSTEMFPLASAHTRGKTGLPNLVVKHLDTLEERFTRYFPSANMEYYDWVHTSFHPLSSASTQTLTMTKKEELT